MLGACLNLHHLAPMSRAPVCRLEGGFEGGLCCRFRLGTLPQTRICCQMQNCQRWEVRQSAITRTPEVMKPRELRWMEPASILLLNKRGLIASYRTANEASACNLRWCQGGGRGRGGGRGGAGGGVESERVLLSLRKRRVLPASIKKPPSNGSLYIMCTFATVGMDSACRVCLATADPGSIDFGESR